MSSATRRDSGANKMLIADKRFVYCDDHPAPRANPCCQMCKGMQTGIYTPHVQITLWQEKASRLWANH
jgi:hypothetical protein